MKLGFLGLGMMGMPIVENILAKGESELYFFARRAEVIQKTNALGGKQVKSLKELGKTCDIIFVLLGNGEQIKTEQKNAIYKDIYDDSMWLINLVENLLSVTRIENGSMELNLQGEIMEDVIMEALRHVNRRGKEQEIEVDCDEFLMVRVDVRLMMQVIINLVDNAIKYTPPLSIISIKAKRFGDRAVISVSDNGPGIPDDQKEELFRMFYTVNHSVADGRRGMGLGLTLCQAIVGAHGSKIKVYDNVPQGTIFRFELKVEDVKL